jgi:gluconate 2-dehydrogenase gamma chain
MSDSKISRRELALLGAWATAQAAQQSASYRVLASSEAREIEAIAAEIIPSGDSPGAREAGCIYFIDRALETFDREQRPLYRKGLSEAQATRRKLFPKSRDIASLSQPERIRLLETIDRTEFFEAVRTHTIMGFFAAPAYGGNRGQLGWKHIGYQPAHHYEFPFGYYDARQEPK